MLVLENPQSFVTLSSGIKASSATGALLLSSVVLHGNFVSTGATVLRAETVWRCGVSGDEMVLTN